MSERVKKTNCEGGGCGKKFEGGMPERVKKTKCGGVAKKKLRGRICRRG